MSAAANLVDPSSLAAGGTESEVILTVRPSSYSPSQPERSLRQPSLVVVVDTLSIFTLIHLDSGGLDKVRPRSGDL
ncbi:hypothetical protein NEUTE2DRAFT_109625 [Neurospora tetrasperma FGSC 2509]|nr:hypothetical protein NEUTE2DRAFT_109625 [Neurospora tetrasperma FGSC 2509]